jgi:hypothetical protein
MRDDHEGMRRRTDVAVQRGRAWHRASKVVADS